MHACSIIPLALAQSPSFCLLTRKMAKSPPSLLFLLCLSPIYPSLALSRVPLPPPPSLSPTPSHDSQPPSTPIYSLSQSVSASLDTDPARYHKRKLFWTTVVIALLRPPPLFGPYFSLYPLLLLPSSLLLLSIIVLPVLSSKANNLAAIMIFLVGSCAPHFILRINNSLLPCGVIISVTPVLYAKAASSVRNEIVCTLRRLQREEQRGRRTEITKVAFIARERERVVYCAARQLVPRVWRAGRC